MPAIAAMVYFTFGLVRGNYRSANFPVEITEENAETPCRILLRMMRALKAVTTLFMAYVAWRIIQVANNMAEGLGAYTLPVFLLVFFGPMAYFIIRSFQER